MKNKRLTVSIGTLAYNEEACIEYMLESVCRQREKNITIREILVISDGSTDRTTEIAKTFKDRRIKIFQDNRRLGKTVRLNQLFIKFHGDLLIVIDADCILADDSTIEKLASRFEKNRKVGMVACQAKPLPGENFLENSVNNFINALSDSAYLLDTENLAYFARAVVGYSRKFAKSLKSPAEVINGDTYSFLMCKSKGLRFIFAEDAIAWYRSPQTIKDYTNQAIRHLAGGVQLHKYFGKETVDTGFKLPKMALIRILLYQLLRNPIGYIFLKTLNIYCHYKSKKLAGKLDIKWATIPTSKKLVLNRNFSS